MRTSFAWLAAGLALVAGPAAARDPPQAPFSLGVLDRDFARFLDWLPGEWDNAEQVNFATELAYPEESAPGRIHWSLEPANVPALGPNAFYLQQYRDNDPAVLARQRVYVLSVDAAKMAIRMDIFTPLDAAPLAPVDGRLARLAVLTREAFRHNDGCEIYWRRQAEQFSGWIEPGACHIRSRSGEMLTVKADLLLTADQFWSAESVVDDNGHDPYRTAALIPDQLRRATAFTCWLAVPRQAPQEGWFYARDLAIRDQGGEVWVTTDETTPRTFGFRMRNVRWPSGPNADALTLYVHTERDTPAISYAWASPEATRIGINLRTIQGSCSR